jgi:diguanylate cyclase (GGDEF)-like protein
MTATGSLDIAQLVELLATVSSFTDEVSAAQGAVERSAQALEAEVAAVVFDGRVFASVGFPAGQVPERQLLAVARQRRGELSVPGIGPCHTTSAQCVGGGRTGALLLARCGERFSVEEQNLIRGMARVLELTLTMLRTLRAEQTMRQRSEHHATENARLVTSLRQRQRLLEHLLEIQSSITRRRPLAQTLDMITAAVLDLLDSDIVVLWLRDAQDADRLRVASSAGLEIEPYRRVAVPLHEAGPAGEAIRDDRLVVSHGRVAPPLDGDCYACLAAPVHESGAVAGSLVVATRHPQRTRGAVDEQSIGAFAEQVSLALTDARTLYRMEEALHDALTGLASRKLFLERLGQRLHHAALDGSTVALLFLDLDRFKEVNDTLGHAAGDQLLMITADRLKAQVRPDDVAARFGGDEFAVMLPRVDGAGEAASVAARIVDALAVPMAIAQRRLVANASIGIALSDPEVRDPAELMHRADVAMYQAKRNGRGRFEMFEARPLFGESPESPGPGVAPPPPSQPPGESGTLVVEAPALAEG